MKKEFNLSEKIESCDIMNECISAENVKEFIRLLKECFGNSILTNKPYHYSSEMIYKEIDKLAGDRLI